VSACRMRLVTVAARGAAPFVDSERFTRALLETGEVSIAVDWWYSLAGVGHASERLRTKRIDGKSVPRRSVGGRFG
jgi:hypothetical protein